MKTKIKTLYPHHVIKDHCSDIYISDYTEQTKNNPVKKGVEIASIKPVDIESFLVKNNKSIPFSSIKFDNKSFVDETTGKTLSHCECICFSVAEYNKGPWILLLELKYCSTHSGHRKESMEKAKNQLTNTYNYYKQKGMINNRQKCYLVVSFPSFPPPFLNFINTQSEVRDMKLKKVIFRGVNELKIKNEFILE
jgi:hypothetical protein